MDQLIHRRLRAPQADGAALIDPPLDQFHHLLTGNQKLAAGWQAAISDNPLTAFIRTARTEFLDKAINYTGEERDTSWLPADMDHAPLLLSGHQPELFHPGVWFKNFLLSTVGQRLGGVAVNLIVDTDTVHSTSVRVPVGTGSDAAIEHVALDAAGDAIPFEERTILDAWLFESFDRRVLAAYETSCISGQEPYQPIIAGIWRRAVDATKRGRDAANLGLVLAQTRHWLEWRLGLQTLEIPLSSVAQSRHFRRFALHLLAQLRQFSRIYNTALAEYRHVNRIRNSTHPVPSLQEQDDWLEAPFYLWTTADPRRRQLFARQVQESLVLTDRRDITLVLDLSSDKAIDQLAAAEARGIKLRPRALITTMYARLVLSDLFIHGIGGAKYDELTDLIIRRFFGIEPPAYVTATATFRLPIERPEVSAGDVRKSARRIRELRYRPEAFLREPLVANDASLSQQLAALAAEKRDFLERHDLRGCSQDVFDRLDRLNRSMHDLLQPVEAEMGARHADLIAQAKQSQLLGSREFSFVLFPAEILPARLLDLCKLSS